jgi:deoxyribonuclease V
MTSDFPQTIQEAQIFQDKIAKKVIIEDTFSKIETVGAFDISYKEDKAFTAGVIINSKSEEVLEEKVIVSKIPFPYVPTYLFLKEVPSFISLFSEISIKPDLVLIDGHGIAHPKNTGSASVFGVLVNIPSIGVAKKPLKYFNYVQTNVDSLDQVILNDKLVGYRYQPKHRWNPIFISPGHKVSVKSSFTLIKDFFKSRFKLPFPSHRAHCLATEYRKSS